MTGDGDDAVEVIRAGALEGVAHGFFGRRGGVSTGAVAGLNAGLGSADDPDAVAENRARAVAAVLPGARLLTPYQVHSADAVTLYAPPEPGWRPRADALVTTQPGLLLGVVTADCAPILLADRQAGVIAAAHAGWRGALGGVVEATLLAMQAAGARAEAVVAAIGPCIARANYEVDAMLFGRFREADRANDRFFTPGRPGHYQFDLEAFVTHRLTRAGVRRVEAPGLDTYADEDRFFSFRRATHRGEDDYGRQIALIGL